jgi:Protein of unknown function (DUF2798)
MACPTNHRLTRNEPLPPAIKIVAAAMRPAPRVIGASPRVRRLPAMIPARYRGMVALFITSLIVSCIVSGVSVAKSVGLAPAFVPAWLSAWGTSWMVAFPVLLVVLPIVQRIVGLSVRQ